MDLINLTAISPIDGRYFNKTNSLRTLMSEYGLIKARVKIEVKWLIFLAGQPGIQELESFNTSQIKNLSSIYKDFTIEDALQIKNIENQTNHDVKAVEYFLKQRLEQNPSYTKYLSFIHFACTSEDINNLAYSVLLSKCREQVLTPSLTNIFDKLTNMASSYANKAMLARTHGQGATPTTMGKELANFAYRINNSLKLFNASKITGKFNGAVGNYNAHHFTYSDINWPELAEQFVHSLDLKFNPYTTQINPHDDIAEYCHHLIQLNNILLGLTRDIWGYISLGYFKQKSKSSEVGSSTMPHKINPIDFENSEGNLGIANSLLTFFSSKLPISRYQRDLSDSTVLRNLGSAFGYCEIAYTSILQGLDKLTINEQLLKTDLSSHWELLAEPIQTMMRRYGIADAYEQLKDLTRGEQLTQALLHEFINNQALPKDIKEELKKLTPNNYTGYAARLTMDFVQKYS